MLYTCNYGQGGNYIGGQLYRAGPACSQCPPGSGCSSQHPGLCSLNTRASLGNKYQQITTTFKNNNINNNINININIKVCLQFLYKKYGECWCT